MLETINFPVYYESLADYRNPEELLDSCRALGYGIEFVWGGDDAMDALPNSCAAGYHLIFYADWLDFWYGEEHALLRKFGSRKAWIDFYSGSDRNALIGQYRADLARAVRLGAKYVVFHVSDVSIEEGYTYRWAHSDWEVLDAAIELINLLFQSDDYPFVLLVENQWWPGFTFTDPEKTAYLLDGICYENKGIMLDIGHLMNTNLDLKSEAEGANYIHRMLDTHGSLTHHIRGVHLHQSLSGAYVKSCIGRSSENIAEDYLNRFAKSYRHILQFDQHKPWSDPSIANVIARINPEFLTHELASKNRAVRETLVARQRATLIKGGLIISHGKAEPSVE